MHATEATASECVSGMGAGGLGRLWPCRRIRIQLASYLWRRGCVSASHGIQGLDYLTRAKSHRSASTAAALRMLSSQPAPMSRLHPAAAASQASDIAVLGGLPGSLVRPGNRRLLAPAGWLAGPPAVTADWYQNLSRRRVVCIASFGPARGTWVRILAPADPSLESPSTAHPQQRGHGSCLAIPPVDDEGDRRWRARLVTPTRPCRGRALGVLVVSRQHMAVPSSQAAPAPR
ncbi:hypothetical protein QBC47DRAFT_446155 [Echria macrotheca]|uniref:Uncharacterized protein n=1 Tax=Echria macrotheca TaxID=438768 RepID=A0AAJ0FBW2_9PEZI|nr:hypothetical protein QBC47DRAFT_446155 [Echria macrotheca]